MYSARPQPSDAARPPISWPAKRGSLGQRRMARNYAQQNRHRCSEGLILGAMKRTIDDLPPIRVAALVALGEIGRDAKTARVRFGDDGVEHQVGVRVRPFPNGGFWAILVCPRCGGGSPVPSRRHANVPCHRPAGGVGRSQRLRLLDDRPACGKCVRGSGLIYRSQSIRTEKRHAVTAPPRLAVLNSDTPARVNPRPGRKLDRRRNLEFALKRSMIVSRKHLVDHAKDLYPCRCRATVAHLDVDAVADVLINHHANIRNTARALKTATGRIPFHMAKTPRRILRRYAPNVDRPRRNFVALARAIPFPAGDLTIGDLALPPVCAELSRCRRFAR